MAPFLFRGSENIPFELLLKHSEVNVFIFNKNIRNGGDCNFGFLEFIEFFKSN